MRVLTAGEIARLVQGELIGQEDLELAGVAPPERAGPRDLTVLGSARYLEAARCGAAGAALVWRPLRGAEAGPATRILVDDTHRALRQVLEAFYPPTAIAWGIHSTSRIGPGTRWQGRIAIGAHASIGAKVSLGADCVIEAYAWIGDGAVLGDRCRVGQHAMVHAQTVLGSRVVIQAGARVGGEGFGFATAEEGPRRIPHVGRCILGDDVEIGANATVDRGSLGDTVIGPGTKIDNLVQVAHNVRIGARCLIMAQAGIAGSTIIEDDVLIAGQAGLAGHLTVHRGARIAAQSGVIGDVPPGATVSGYPARRHREVLRQTAALKRLAPLVETLERLARHDPTR
jgi:UDP-3-O-[3-hydroxymyristoyl] glucosamine N-acyltransferase